MKALKWTLAATAVVTLMTLGAPIHAQAQTAAHDHGSAPQALTLNHGQKWATDAPLRFSGWMARLLQPLFKL